MMVQAILSEPMLSVGAALIACFAMVWPGYALLHVMGYGQRRWPAALFAGPSTTLALWIISLSGAAWARIPLSAASPLVRDGSLILACVGLGLRFVVRGRRPIGGGRLQWTLWIVAALIPLVVMPTIFTSGLGVFAASDKPDAFNYIAVADYLMTVPRGSEGGLAPLYQYAASFMNSRNAAPSIVAHLAIGAGSVKPDQVAMLYCIIVLFCMCAALAAFGILAFQRTSVSAVLVLLAGLTWPSIMIYAGSFDQLLSIALLPALASIAWLASAERRLIRPGILIGVFVAAGVLGYIELALVELPTALAFIIPVWPTISHRGVIRLAAMFLLTSLSALLLVGSGVRPLLDYFALQTTAAYAAGAGNGYTFDLLSRLAFEQSWPSLLEAFALQPVTWPLPPLIAVFAVLLLTGLWVERRRFVAVAAVGCTFAACAYFVVERRYIYGAYKIFSVNFWLVSFFVVAGGLWLSDQVKNLRRWKTEINLGGLLTTAALVVAIAAMEFRYGQKRAEAQSRYRQAIDIAAIIQATPTLFAVKNQTAHKWGLFYLSGNSLLVESYKPEMGEQDANSIMGRSRRVDLAEVEFLVADSDQNVSARFCDVEPVWQGDIYRLWRVKGVSTGCDKLRRNPDCLITNRPR
jgi:hypothetical protein